MKVTSNGAYVDVGSTVEAFLPFRSMTRRKGEANSPADLVKEERATIVRLRRWHHGLHPVSRWAERASPQVLRPYLSRLGQKL
eukprot:6255594-Amphidinium_carterae.1